MLLDKLKNAFIQVIESSRKRVDFRTMSYLPRWAILCFDTSIIFIALLVTKIIVSRLRNVDYISLIPTLEEWSLLVVNVLFFILYRTYAGLIRHSTFIDAIKFFLASLSTIAFSLVCYYISSFVSSEELFKISKLFLYGVISFCGLFLFRVLVKQVFDVYFKYLSADKVVNVLVYGTDENAIAIANALKSEKPTRFKVLGFIDKKGKNKSKEILGLPIIHIQKNVAVILRVYKANAIILADNTLTKDESINIIDNCINYKFKVFRAPLISDIEENSNLSNQIQKIQIEDILDREPIKLDNKLVAKELYNKCIIVTGGAGSIGSEIVRQVSNYKPSKLIILDQAESPLYRIQLEIANNFPNLNFEAVIADVRDLEILESIFKKYKPQVIYHAAAYKHVPLMEKYPNQAVTTNVFGTKNVTDLALKYEAEKFVMVSTDKAVNPSNVMGATKRVAEIYVQALQEQAKINPINKTQYVTTRFGNVLGSNGSVVPLFKRQLEKGGPLTITHPDIIRYFMTIPEACQLVLEAGAMGNGGEVFIFDMGKAVKIIDLAKKIILLAGYQPYKDIDIQVIGLRPGEKLYEELLNDKSETLPTYNEKIMIATVESCEYSQITKNIEDLEKNIQDKDIDALVQKMKNIVPEFISMNSQYEKMD